MARPGVGVAERLERAGQVQRAGGERVVEGFEKESTEETRQDAHRQEEPGPTGDPAGAVGGKPAAGDDAVQMGMMHERLSPGVQHGEEADFGAEMPGSAAMIRRVSAVARNSIR
jgi:hypothetical protein